MMLFPKTEKEWLELRHLYVSSTESAALFGLSPYSTAYELAVSKKEPLKEFAPNERMAWGLRLQEAIAKGISEDYGVKVRRVRGYSVNPNCNMGASFDYEIVGLLENYCTETNDPMLRQMYKDLGPGILEIKNVDYYIFKQQWKTEDGQLEAPAHIEIQVQHQLHCIERRWGVMGVLVGGNDTQLVLRERDEEVGASIERKVGDFWASLGRGEMPPVKLPEDVEIIRRLYMGSTPGKVMDSQGDDEIKEMCKNYREAMECRDAHENARKSIGARLLMKIGDAEKVLVDGYGISAGTVGETVIESYTRKSYRNLTVREKKVKT
jgi:putative phage-type endonuclease